MNYFLLNNRWNRPTVWWTESTMQAHRVHGLSLNDGRPSGDLQLGFK
jgi:hypothetical protein